MYEDLLEDIRFSGGITLAALGRKYHKMHSWATILSVKVTDIKNFIEDLEFEKEILLDVYEDYEIMRDDEVAAESLKR